MLGSQDGRRRAMAAALDYLFFGLLSSFIYRNPEINEVTSPFKQPNAFILCQPRLLFVNFVLFTNNLIEKWLTLNSDRRSRR